MPLKNTPIKRKLMVIILITNGVVLLMTCAAFSVAEVFIFRQNSVRHLTTLGDITGANSTAALAFDNQDDAADILVTLKAERHVVAACLYDNQGQLFAKYPGNLADNAFPPRPQPDGYRFEHGYLAGFQPVVQNDKRLGTIYLRSDLGAMYERFRLYSLIVVLVIAGSLLVAYLLSQVLQQQISRPILALAETARAVSEHRDYSVRTAKLGRDELGLLTDAFNQMLIQITSDITERKQAEAKIQGQLGRLNLLNQITRGIGERQDLPSIFQVILRSLEDNLPIDFGCICLYESAGEILTVISVGERSGALAVTPAITRQTLIPIDQNGLARCVRGELVYEPDISQVQFPFPQRLAAAGLHSLVIAPLLVEGNVFGILVAARCPANSFSSADCEFLRQLTEHAALAAHQARLNGALQQAYDDLQQSQITVMQQERLRALGQMASGIAHDINNAISPVTLYTESLLERDTTLSDRARDYLRTIQRAIEDVAQTVSRMREFYRQREPQLVLAPIELNRLVQQAIDLTRARWSDLSLEQGIVIHLETQLASELPVIMGAEGEIRDALTNLVFNAVDAMPQGGTLTLRTRVVSGRERGLDDEAAGYVYLEVGDTGVGMDEETKRRCLEPFFTTKGERGTGLGLAMVYGMVQRHSSEVDIQSELGKGTTVSLIFPVAAPVQDSAVHPAVPLMPAHPLRILLVDDDPLLIKSLRDTLEADGHFIGTADGGQEGIEAFVAAQNRGEPFAAVITDLGMPYIDGRKVAAAVKASSLATPVIMLTGWGQRLKAENDIPAHVDRVLNKPPRLNEIRAALAELTAGAGPK